MQVIATGVLERLAYAALRVACTLLDIAETVHSARLELRYQVRRWSR